MFYSQLKLVWQTFTFIDFAEITKFSKFMPYIESLKAYPWLKFPSKVPRIVRVTTKKFLCWIEFNLQYIEVEAVKTIALYKVVITGHGKIHYN